MNDQNPIPPIPPQIPPQLPPVATPGGQRPLGDDPSERAAIPNVIVAIEAILRQPRRVMFQLRQPGAGRLIAAMLFVSVVCSLIYGVVAGTFSGGTQLWAAPVKIAAGLMISALICLPSLYIFTCLGGSQAQLVEVSGLLAGLLMLMTILLIGFAPVAWIFSQSTESPAWMGTLASDFLVHRHLLRAAISGNRIFALERPVPRRIPHLGGHLHARRAANDDRAATHPGNLENFFADGEKILCGPLGRLFEGAG